MSVTYAFDCVGCGFTFAVSSEALSWPDADSGDDMCCPVCRHNHFMIHPKVTEGEEP